MLSEGSADDSGPQSDREEDGSSRGSEAEAIPQSDGDIEDGPQSDGDIEDGPQNSGDTEDSGPSDGGREDGLPPGGDREAGVTLDRLLRDYRLLKRERRKRELHTTYCQGKIHKQQVEVDKLRRQQRELRESLAALEARQDQEHGERLALLMEMDEMDDGIVRERRRQAELDRESAAVLRQLKKMGHLLLREQDRADNHRQEAGSLDFRLNAARTCLNERAWQNAHLRDDIDILRKVRAHFQSLHARLEAELQRVKREARQLGDRTQAAYEARVRARLETKALRREGAREATRDRARQKEALEELAWERQAAAFTLTKNHQELDPDEEERAWVAAGGDSYETLEEIFFRVKGVLAEPGLHPDRLVWRYIRGDEVNAELTVTIGDQTDEREELKTHTGQVEEAIVVMTEEDAEATRQHLRLLEETEARQAELDEKLKNVEFMLRATAPTLRKFQRLNVRILDTVAQKEKKQLDEELGDEHAKVTEENLLSYMGLVEEKTDDLLKWQAELQAWHAEREMAKSPQFAPMY